MNTTSSNSQPANMGDLTGMTRTGTAGTHDTSRYDNVHGVGSNLLSGKHAMTNEQPSHVGLNELSGLKPGTAGITQSQGLSNTGSTTGTNLGTGLGTTGTQPTTIGEHATTLKDTSKHLGAFSISGDRNIHTGQPHHESLVQPHTHDSTSTGTTGMHGTTTTEKPSLKDRLLGRNHHDTTGTTTHSTTTGTTDSTHKPGLKDRILGKTHDTSTTGTAGHTHGTTGTTAATAAGIAGNAIGRSTERYTPGTGLNAYQPDWHLGGAYDERTNTSGAGSQVLSDAVVQPTTQKTTDYVQPIHARRPHHLEGEQGHGHGAKAAAAGAGAAAASHSRSHHSTTGTTATTTADHPSLKDRILGRTHHDGDSTTGIAAGSTHHTRGTTTDAHGATTTDRPSLKERILGKTHHDSHSSTTTSTSTHNKTGPIVSVGPNPTPVYTSIPQGSSIGSQSSGPTITVGPSVTTTYTDIPHGGSSTLGSGLTHGGSSTLGSGLTHGGSSTLGSGLTGTTAAPLAGAPLAGVHAAPAIHGAPVGTGIHRGHGTTATTMDKAKTKVSNVVPTVIACTHCPTGVQDHASDSCMCQQCQRFERAEGARPAVDAPSSLNP